MKLAVLIAAAAWFPALLTIVIIGLSEKMEPVDVIVVPGSRVEADGRPSAGLAARLNRAAALYNAGWSRLVIVSGGQGQTGYNEAVVMSDYLIDLGLPPSAVIVDDQGLNTRATAAFTASLMAERRLERAMAVTQFFHVPRTRLALRQAGVPVAGGSYARFLEWRDFYSLNREVPALLFYCLFPSLKNGPRNFFNFGGAAANEVKSESHGHLLKADTQ